MVSFVEHSSTPMQAVVLALTQVQLISYKTADDHRFCRYHKPLCAQVGSKYRVYRSLENSQVWRQQP